MIAAVIVTYNRKELLARNVSMLLRQTKQFDNIFIIDNCSTDGTYQMLVDKTWLNSDQFTYIKTATNIGGAGGFYTGTKAAYEAGADWIVLMDDDGCAADEKTFEQLFNVVEQLENENKNEGKLFINTLVQQGDYLSFKIDNMYTVEEVVQASSKGILENAANPFNGTLVTRRLVEEIGYPNPAFFIKGDEVDYKQRAYEAGAYVATVVDARYNHPRPETQERVVLGIKVPFFVEAPWKEYYAARNFTYMYKQKKQYKAILFELVFVKMLAIFSTNCKKWNVIKMLMSGVYDGWRGRLGVKAEL